MTEEKTGEESPQDTVPQEISQGKTFASAFREMTMSDEEAAKLEDDEFKAASTVPRVKAELKKEEAAPEEFEPQKDPNSIPEWVSFPQGFKIPPNKTIAFMYFRASWTDRPDKGDRWCMVWPLSDSEEKLALKRTRGDNARTLSELAKQTIHLIDGKKADWSGTPTDDALSVERFWNECGSKCRGQITNYYVKTHNLNPAEQADFFENCLVVRTAKVG